MSSLSTYSGKVIGRPRATGLMTIYDSLQIQPVWSKDLGPAGVFWALQVRAAWTASIWLLQPHSVTHHGVGHPNLPTYRHMAWGLGVTLSPFEICWMMTVGGKKPIVVIHIHCWLTKDFLLQIAGLRDSCVDWQSRDLDRWEKTSKTLNAIKKFL